MAKTQAYPSIEPTQFSVSQGVYGEDALEVSKGLNYCFGHSLASQAISVVSSEPAWGSSADELATHRVFWPAASGYTTVYAGKIYVDPDVVVLGVDATVRTPAANTGRVRFTIGASNVVINYTAGTVTSATTMNTSGTGTGLLSFTIEVDHQSGGSAVMLLVRWGIRWAAVTSGLLDPSG